MSIVSGQRVRASSVNSYLVPAGIADVRYTRLTTQAIPNNASTKLAFTSSDYTGTDVVVTSGTDFALNRAGLWLLSGQVIVAGGGASALRILSIAKSTDLGYKYAINALTTASECWLSATSVTRVTAGQSVCMFVYQVSGGSLNAGGVAVGECVFTATWLRP